MKYIFTIEYEVPEFAEVEIDTDGDINEARELAMVEFNRMYPEAIDPEIVTFGNV